MQHGSIEPPRLRPKAGWYALSAVPFALGLAGAVIFAVLAVRAFPDRPEQFTAPGAHVLRLDHAEPQTIYLVGTEGTPDCSVRESHSERPVPVRLSDGSTLTIGDDRYDSVLDFDPPMAATYLVNCRPAPGGATQQLAVGKRLRVGHLAIYVIAAIGSFLVGGFLGAVVIAVVAVRRHQHKRRLGLS